MKEVPEVHSIFSDDLDKKNNNQKEESNAIHNFFSGIYGALTRTSASKTNSQINSPNNYSNINENIHENESSNCEIHDIVFNEPSLGIRVKDGGNGLQIIYFPKKHDGSPGEAEKNGLIKLGDFILSIAGEKVDNLDKFCNLVREGKRPLTVTVKRYENKCNNKKNTVTNKEVTSKNIIQENDKKNSSISSSMFVSIY